MHAAAGQAQNILLILGYVIQKTRLGRALRAISFDRDTAQLMGIDSTRIIQLTFVISGALAGISGVFLVKRAGA